MARLVDAHWNRSREDLEMFITPEAMKGNVLDERARQLLQEEARSDRETP